MREDERVEPMLGGDEEEIDPENAAEEREPVEVELDNPYEGEGLVVQDTGEDAD